MGMVTTLKRLALSLLAILWAVPSFGAVKLYTQNTAPATCNLGDLWVDTNATSGERFYTCEAANTWVLHVGYGTASNPSFNSVHASGGNLAAANKQVTKAWQSGLSYTADVTSVIHGGKHWIAKTTHTAGSTTEPGVGANYSDAWAEVSGSGDNLGSATYSNVVALWASGSCSGYLKNDGTCDTPSGSATYPSSAGLANWTGSAWGASQSLGTGVSTWLATPSGANLAAALTSALPASKGGTGLTSLGTGVATALGNAVDTAGGLASYSGIRAVVLGTGLTKDTDTPSAGTDTFRVTYPVTAEAFSGSGWDSDTNGLQRNDAYDYLHIADTDDDGLPNKVDLSSAGLVATDASGVLSSTSTLPSATIVPDSGTLTFDESAADPNDADIQLSATDGVFKIAAVNGANNEDLTLDLDAAANKAKFNSGSGLTLITTGSIPFTGAIRTVGKDSDYTIGTDDADEAYGSFFINTGASTRTFTLPSAVAGMSVCVRNGQGVSQILRLDANTGDYIVKSTGARTSAAAEYYGATADAKNQLCVVAYDATDWYVTSEVGTWTEE